MSTEQAHPQTKPKRLGSRRTISTNVEPTEPVVTERHHPEAPDQAETSAPMPRSVATTPEPTERTARPRPRREAAAVERGSRARFDELERKEARLREDQVDELNRLARTLAKEARRRRPSGSEAERITDNTLIRVAVDLLLTRASELSGLTEAELRKSVGLSARP